MRRFLQILYTYRTFLLFLTLEVISVLLVINNNDYQRTAFLSTSNRVVGSFLTLSSEVQYYFNLNRVNTELATENAQLRERIAKGEFANRLVRPENLTMQVSLPKFNAPGLNDFVLDTTGRYSFIPAKVINNSLYLSKNHITLNKGTRHGIKPDMGVISPFGTVGKVLACSQNFSTVTSLLHTDLLVSSTIKSTGTLCSTSWDGRDPTRANLQFVPRHVNVQVNDTIITSGYNAVFPAGIMVGVVKNVEDNDEGNFLDIDVDLATSFSSLSYVYVIEDEKKTEIDSLEQQIRTYE